MHSVQESEKGLAHGRVDGPIPSAKLAEFQRSEKHAVVAGDDQFAVEPAGGRRPRGRRQVTRQNTPRGSYGEDLMPVPALPATTGKPTEGKQFLLKDGSAWSNPPAWVRGGGWSAEEVWNAAEKQHGGHREPIRAVHVSRPHVRPEYSVWGAAAADALARIAPAVWCNFEDTNAAPVMSGRFGKTGNQDIHISITSDAVREIKEGMEKSILADLLAELHDLSSHRVGLLDGTAGGVCKHEYDFGFKAALLAERELGPDGKIGSMANEDGKRRIAAELEHRAADEWIESLHQRQRLHRIGPVDVRALLSRPYAGIELVRGRKGNAWCLPEATRRHVLQLIAEQDLHTM